MSGMWAFILIALLAGCLFLSSAIHSWKQLRHWAKAQRLQAQVQSVQYHEAREDGNIVNNALSSAAVTLCFVCEGLTIRREKVYKGLLNIPSQGAILPVLYNRNTGSWGLESEVHYHWFTKLLLALLCFALSAAFLVDGKDILAQMSDYSAETPNQTGNLIFAVAGTVLCAGGLASARHLLPAALLPFLDFFGWFFHYLSGSFDLIDAHADGLLKASDGDGSYNYYLIFSYWAPEGSGKWYSQKSCSKRQYQQGALFCLYRDKHTGKLYLKPSVWDAASVIISILPLLFLLMIVLSFTLFGISLLYCSGSGFLRMY